MQRKICPWETISTVVKKKKLVMERKRKEYKTKNMYYLQCILHPLFYYVYTRQPLALSPFYREET